MKKFIVILAIATLGVVAFPFVGRCDDRPAKNEKKTEREGKARNLGDMDEFVFAVKIPKPEALIFEKRRKTRYTPLSNRKSFTYEIIRSGRDL